MVRVCAASSGFIHADTSCVCGLLDKIWTDVMLLSCLQLPEQAWKQPMLQPCDSAFGKRHEFATRLMNCSFCLKCFMIGSTTGFWWPVICNI